MVWMAYKPAGVDPSYDQAVSNVDRTRQELSESAARHNASRCYSVMYREALSWEMIDGEKTLVMQLLPIVFSNRPLVGVWW